jgi:hypothetical protein
MYSRSLLPAVGWRRGELGEATIIFFLFIHPSILMGDLRSRAIGFDRIVA